MSPELLQLLLEKVKLPNMFKAGLVISYVVFKGFDIEGQVKRAMHKAKPA